MGSQDSVIHKDTETTLFPKFHYFITDYYKSPIGSILMINKASIYQVITNLLPESMCVLYSVVAVIVNSSKYILILQAAANLSLVK